MFATYLNSGSPEIIASLFGDRRMIMHKNERTLILGCFYASPALFWKKKMTENYSNDT
jgi:hypothetical protein